jgi:uncharacterized protein (DUF305 family)
MRTKGFRRTLAAAVFVALSVATAAAQDHTGHTGQQQPGHTGHGQMGDMPYDLHFIDMTIMHHEHGVEMARLAEEKASDARVKAFAKKTADDQQRDIATLRGHRQHWYSDKPEMSHEQMMSHMQAMQGHGQMKGMAGHGDMMAQMQQHMDKLRAAEGRAFDLLFLDTMTGHHKMAVEMSKEAVTRAEHAEIKDFARKVVAKQQGEIAEMGRIKASLGGGRKTAARKPAPKKKPAAKPAAHAGHH